MTRVALGLLAGALGLAAVDWLGCTSANWRVSRLRYLRYAGKPGAMVLLIAAAFALHPANELQRDIFVAALVLSLFGDIYLLLSERWFMPGLGTFLLAHIAYSAGFAAAGPQLVRLGVATVVVGIASLLVGRRLIGAPLTGGGQVPVRAVAAYLAAISVMVVLAAAGGKPAALAGAVLFYVSDAMIARDRFVEPWPALRLPIIVSYHLAQGLLVLSLL